MAAAGTPAQLHSKFNCSSPSRVRSLLVSFFIPKWTTFLCLAASPVPCSLEDPYFSELNPTVAHRWFIFQLDAVENTDTKDVFFFFFRVLPTFNSANTRSSQGKKNPYHTLQCLPSGRDTCSRGKLYIHLRGNQVGGIPMHSERISWEFWHLHAGILKE